MMPRADERAVLAVNQLSWGYGDCLLGVGLDLMLRGGQMVALVGPNGAGKSTLLKTLAGVIAPCAGEVWLAGELASALPPRQRARRVAFLPQIPVDGMGMTVHELVSLGRTPYLGAWGRPQPPDLTAVDRALALCDLEALKARRVDQLSGGERQRAQLGLVVAQEASLIVLDEPSTHLDLRWRHGLYELLKRLRDERGIAVVCALHDLSDAFGEADRVLLVAQGKATALAATDAGTRDVLARAFAVPSTRIVLG